LFDAYEYNTLDTASSGWSGSISDSGGIVTTKMYKVKLAKGQNLNIKGVPVDLNNWSFNLTTNWNWLPYVVSKNVPIGEALANYRADDGDLIKSQSAFAIYTPSIGWKGTLSFLKAGEGYMIKSATAQKLTYPSYLNESNSKITSSISTKLTRTTLNENLVEGTALSKANTKFSTNMSAIVKLPEGYKTLSFYTVTGELRGSGETIKVDGIDLVFITIYGEKSETLTAYIGNGGITHSTTTTIGFIPDAILGSIPDPFIIELPETSINFSPNPFSTILNMTFTSLTQGDANVVLLNSTGQKVFENNFKIIVGANLITIQPAVPQGIYIVKVEFGDKIQVKKIIKY
jgi:hypothetical protein